MLERCDILCIQEHWLLSFEGKEIGGLFPDHNFAIKCIDDDIPAAPKMRSRGTAGTAILWKDSIDHVIEPLPDGGDRLQVVRISMPGSPLLLINTYMPTSGSTQAEYDDLLAEVAEVMSKYDDCDVTWTGDINADTMRRQPTVNDKKLVSFLSEYHLEVSPKTPLTPTYHHFMGNSASRLDVFIQREGTVNIQSIRVHSREALNISPHDAVSATVHAEIIHKAPPNQNPAKKPAPNVRWEKVDKAAYLSDTEVQLTALKASMDDLPASITADRVNSILTKCAIKSCPPPPKRKRRTKYRWYATFKPLAKNVIAAYRDHRDNKHSLHSGEKFAALKAAKKILRKAQRQAAARRRCDVTAAIITSCRKNNRDEFYRLVKRQRRCTKKPVSVNFEEHTKDTETDSWASYFEWLSTPKDDPNFDEDYNRYLMTNYLLQSLTAGNEPLPPVSEAQIHKIVKSLKMNKAPDIFGVCSEHIRLASPVLLDILTHLTNDALKKGHLPDLYKLGSVCPIPKKTKPPKRTNSYRRITITAIVGKVVELHTVSMSRAILDPQQSPYQFGFTKGCSPVYAALMLTEIIAEAKDSGTELYITLMDTSKAFDVVDHREMLNSLHEQGVTGTLWRIYDSMYDNIKSVVKWRGELSEPFREKQGIRQGGSSSADNYKGGKNSLLYNLQEASCNTIGNLNTGALMVADDLTITSTVLYNMQAGLNIASRDSSRARYSFNMDKTKIIAINTKVNPNLMVNSIPLGTSKAETHLGIIRNCKGTNMDTVDSRIISARRAILSLLGAGMRGYNGTGPEVGALQYNTYVVPILLYGLEALVLTGSELLELENFHRQNLRFMQHLPKSTAKPAIHLLCGVPPVEALLDVRALSMFRNVVAMDISNPPAAFIRELIVRQVAMKGPESASWTTHIKSLLHHYKLPSAFDIIEDPPDKKEWKRTVKEAVHQRWTNMLQEQAKDMSSLEFLNTQACSTNHMHPVWQELSCALAIKKATVKAMLLTKRYPLSSSKTAGAKRSELCPLCNTDAETTAHFLLQCSSLLTTRRPYLHRIMDTCRRQGVSIDPETLTKIVLDTTHLPTADRRHEETCRNLTYKLHHQRAVLLGGLSAYTQQPVRMTNF